MVIQIALFQWHDEISHYSIERLAYMTCVCGWLGFMAYQPL